MSFIKSLVKRIRAAGLALQVLMVLLAFGVMAVSSYSFVGQTEMLRMDQHVFSDLQRAQARIEADLGRVSSMTAGLSLTVRNMLVWGDSLPEILRHFGDVSNYMQHSNVPGFLRTFLYFDGRDVIMIPSSDILSDTVNIAELPWYVAAVAANGEVVFTDPYVSALTGELIIACARRIFDDDGKPLGIVGMHVTLEPLKGHINNICFSYGPMGAYGILIDSRARVIVHHKTEWVGKPISETLVNLGAQFSDELIAQGKDSLLRREVFNYRKDKIIVSFKKIPLYQWYIGLVIPKSVYLKHSHDTLWYFLALNALVLAVLCYVLWRLSLTKRSTDEFTRLVFDAIPLACDLWDGDGKIVMCNEASWRLCGARDRQEYLSSFYKYSPEYQPNGELTMVAGQRYRDQAITEGISRFEWMHITSDGEPVPGDVTLVRVKYRGEPAILAYNRDKREEIAILEKLREADERAMMMLDIAPVDITMWDRANRLIDCNMKAANVLGIDNKSEFLEKYWSCVPEVQPDGKTSGEKLAWFMSEARAKGYARMELYKKHVNGELIPFDATGYSIKYRDEDVVVVYCNDQREFKAMVREAHRAEIAEESSKAKSRFLASMSHEIRTPMNVILGVTDIQLQDDTLPPHLREAFTQVYNSSDLLLGIINDILDLSKIEANKMVFTPAKYSLASLINDTAHLNMMRNSKPIEFELNVCENAPMQLFGDELRIKQILNNLLSNAFKFTDEGAVKLSVKVEDGEPSGSDNDVTLVMTISDTGQGMSKEQIGKLFTEYTRFNLDTNRYIEGTGLGMNITRRLTNMMGGDIIVDSGVGRGTTVAVRLPQKRVGDRKIGRELAENLRRFRVDASVNMRRTQITRDYMPYGRVLIVDDVESNLYVARGLMASYGLSIDTVTSGQKAIDNIKSGKRYDVIFMDHMMPKMDGIEATKIIREIGCDIPIVALTANAVVGQAEIFLSNGFDEFISKPIDIRQLNAILNRFIRDKQTPEVLELAKQAKDRLAKNLPRPTADPELLAVFVRDAVKTLPILESVAADAAQASDEEMLLFAINTHAMKSALANIGESGLAQVAYTLEKSGKTHDRKTIALQTPSFIKALKGLIDKAEAERNLKECAATDESPQFLKEQLDVIAKACRDYDEKTIGAVLDSLRKMSWTAKTEDVLNKIAELQLHSNFEEAAEVAARAADQIG